ncbi:hypothetical protein J5N97_028550 [Dioscorea zingiberensis]|uniref:Uncharacterized protein n=1 Tax=Dioscorea zingiberensis TaxID=325984 RepID=A0A9D5BZQ3_9LILI|nr:hypothetical protein J5N97_028550 [Dioscorea zingiberensis]
MGNGSNHNNIQLTFARIISLAPEPIELLPEHRVICNPKWLFADIKNQYHQFLASEEMKEIDAVVMASSVLNDPNEVQEITKIIGNESRSAKLLKALLKATLTEL